jgi:UTP--glucose-1-phosphate uridylyltransferase
MKKITKAIIPAAGFGTRFLPATKAQPKEMLPIVDKPIIQYVVEEVVNSGVEDIIIVTGWQKRSIEDHFDYPFELEKRLEESGKLEQLKEVRRIANLANFIYIRQKGPYGNATPVICAKHLISNEPFAVLWGDDFIYAKPPRLSQLINVYNKYQSIVLSVIETNNPEDTQKYGFIKSKQLEESVYEIEELIEKPGPKNAPSNLASVSGYILTPEIFPILDSLMPGKDQEFWLVDAIKEFMKKNKVYACKIRNGKYYDTGNKLEYIKANIDFALKRKDLAPGLKSYLKKLDSQKCQ